MSAIQVAVITVSDTAATDTTYDRSGPLIHQILSSRPGFIPRTALIVPDDLQRIRDALLSLAQRNDVDCVLTTGGTGLGVRDVTPEAVKSLLEREAPGLVHIILDSSIKHTPLAALSRPVAGTIQNKLVITLPGSPKAVTENLDALLSGGLLQHAVELIRGGSGKPVHAALAAGHLSTVSAVSGSMSDHTSKPHHHHHHHHHTTPTPRSHSMVSHDPTASAATRHRQSPYPLLSMEAALYLVNSHITSLPAVMLPVDHHLSGHILAEDVYAPQDAPATPTTNVDGYALRATDPAGVYNVLTHHTHAFSESVPRNAVFRINTGAPLPCGTDAVIMVEDTRLVSATRDTSGSKGDEKEVETLVQVSVGENVRTAGSDVRKDELVMVRGDLIGSGGGEIGTLTFVGREAVSVYKKPVVALLSTGNEIISLQNGVDQRRGDGWGGIYDTNRPSLQAVLEGLGYTVVDLGIVADDLTAHTQAIQRGLNEADLVLTTGGTSMGPSDLLKPVIERNFNGTIHFGRVAVKPGKPTTFATIPFHGVEKPVFALPGNPASALVMFYVFVVPALRRLGGWPDKRCSLPRVHVQLQSPIPLDPRLEFHRVVIRAGRDGLKAFSTGGQRSSRVASLSGANGFIFVPRKTVEGPVRLEAGEMAEALVIGELQM